jgi:hypothetical protein
MDGSHSIERCEEVTETVLHAVFDALHNQRIRSEGMLLKPNMVIAGKEYPQQAPVQEVAVATLRCLRRHVPAAVPGVVFLSGGQEDRAATVHFNAINCLPGPKPWKISFSFTGARSRTTRWRRGTAETRTWARAGKPCTNAPAATAPPVSARTRMKWRPCRSAPRARRTAVNGATTEGPIERDEARGRIRDQTWRDGVELERPPYGHNRYTFDR